MPERRLQKILIANRGEIAVRIIRTCHEMGIRTVAVFSDADRSMPHVSKADEAYYLGPSPSRESYLAIDKILSVARQAHVDAIHPGYGFLSENPDFAQRVFDAGIIFIGPRPESIRAMGDKTEARKLVARSGVPIVPGTEQPLTSLGDADEFCGRHGFPILLKAAAGGGGKGMRVVHSTQEFAASFKSAQSEARSAFGDPRIYIEKYLDAPRHVEFQILSDTHGTTIHLGERECSIQRRHQKVIEETPCVILDDALRHRMGETAIKAAQACQYQNAGTIEFLLDRDKNFYFLEMNTRLQVEHPITEMRTGIDLVAQQIDIALGHHLSFTQSDITWRGHAIECRIYAEDCEDNFYPSTGRITHLKPPGGFGVRDERGVDSGAEISVYYDSMIAKLVVWANSRAEAIERMKRALREYEILGVKTNIPVCIFVMEHQKFLQGDYDTHFLSTHFSPAILPRLSEDERKAAAIVCALLTDRTTNGRSIGSINPSAASMNSRTEQNLSYSSSSKWKQRRRDTMRTR